VSSNISCTVECYHVDQLDSIKLKDVDLKTVEVVGEGDSVTEMGEYHLKMEQGEDKGKYMVVWKSPPEGWKLHWDIWNTSKAPTE